MAITWGPSTWGRRLTRSKAWTLQLDDEAIVLVVDGIEHRAPISSDPPVSIQQGLFWASVTLHPSQRQFIGVRGIPNKLADRLQSAIDSHVRRKTKRDRFHQAYSQLRPWTRAAAAVVFESREKRTWITHEQQDAIFRQRPNIGINHEDLTALFEDADVQSGMDEDALQECRNGLGAWKVWQTHDAASLWATFNEEHTKRELDACKELFDRVEKQPLSEEQARAVICFDNRVQVVASAGSGKTSTMVAKAAYALHREFVSPDKIVMLAFNKSAAEELKERAVQSFQRLGLDGVEVDAKTFHALGIQIIGEATGKKPRVPSWVENTGESLKKLNEIIDKLKDQSPGYRTKWDMFRIVYGRDIPAFGAPSIPDAWDKTGKPVLRTLAGDLVKSQEEFIIANWLFYNGVNYQYERAYGFDTRDAKHSQYMPDFYYPDIDLYHEHFALDEHGNAPPNFIGYLDGVAWKRQEHALRGTSLIETTSDQIWKGDHERHLTKELTDRGIALDPDPDRPVPTGGQPPIEHGDLVGLIRSFISHAKSNCLTAEALLAKVEQEPKGSFKYRHRMFLELVEPIRKAWDAALSEAHGIDFEDMLNQAAEHVELGRYKSPYELVMADEFQDASMARARLCRALVQEPGRHLCAVGDDWQSINRFAGSDVSVMTGFKQWFGSGTELRLQQTFRCPQQLCDLSSQFISKNPAQIKKVVVSNTKPHGPVAQAFQVKDRNELQSAVEGYLTTLHQSLGNGEIEPGRNGKVSVFVLGRYNADESYVPPDWKRRFGRRLEVKFTTAHSSKGSEADYVIMPSLVHKGFPNTRIDDPVLGLAMPQSDNFPFAEERRLFYVALTRARRAVAMFTVSGKNSSFLDELVQDGFVTITDTEGEPVVEERCTVCKVGVIVERTGPYGKFRGCTNYPNCHNKPRARPAPSRTASNARLTLAQVLEATRTSPPGILPRS